MRDYDGVVVTTRRWRKRAGLRRCRPQGSWFTAHYSGGRDRLVLVQRHLNPDKQRGFECVELDYGGMEWLARRLATILDERAAHKNREVHSHVA